MKVLVLRQNVSQDVNIVTFESRLQTVDFYEKVL